MATNNLSNLQFIITEKDFIVDTTYHSDNNKVLKLQKEFLEDKYQALYYFGFRDNLSKLSVSAHYLYMISDSFIKELTNQPQLEIARENIDLEIHEDTYDYLLDSIPFIVGNEYINREWLDHIFIKLAEIFASEIKDYSGSVQFYLTEKSQDLTVAHRIYFHLVDLEDKDYPFAFMASYATKTNNKIEHVPLKYALEEYKDDRLKLISLLSCLNKVAEVSPLIAHFMETGEMFHPVKLTAKEAYELLLCVPEIEKCHVKCRVPNWWRKKNSSISINVSIGDREPSTVGFNAILEMDARLAVNGQKLSDAEIEELLDHEEGLVWFKGQWVEINHHRLEELLEHVKEYDGTVTLKEAFQSQMEAEDIDVDDGVTISNGEWLNNMVNNLRDPNRMNISEVPHINATLRPYQQSGYTWLNYMNQFGFGACLADDMGLGKTLQVLTFLENMYEQNQNAHVLLIVPASLLGNWSKEIEKFVPDLNYYMAHGMNADFMSEELRKHQPFLVITTYAMASKIQYLNDITWDCLILDEAQAIKNPQTKQTRNIKKLNSKMRIAMTGTPIENELTNLWSLFDFLNKGLLGSSDDFKKFSKTLEYKPQNMTKLRNMVSPFILRRVKTDKSIISDLPDKIEVIDHIDLTKKQQAYYQRLTKEVIDQINNSKTSFQRKGIILSALTKYKQICNHPDQYLHKTDYIARESGKFEMLKSICETIYTKRERVLVFTQYREICDYLSEYLETIFHKEGFVLHGGTPVRKRQEIVERFNSDEEYIPYIVLSLKAAGTGLNLIGANHVIHFDRWWNPAVENQASDRAFRIGQKKNVFVHKFVCNGTIEEKIDKMIELKQTLADEIITTDTKWITEMSNDELLNLLTLDGDANE
ncbi:MAG: DEAD/DEAH box helicase [Erysipelotrichaceae bacterium]|nr:DEAD/DEAH box helicase [Erysipelotrichaceae bacterium]